MAVDSKSLATWEPDPQEMDIYRRQFAPQGTTDDEWEIFLKTCQVYRISPMRKQIYLVSRYDSVKKRNVSVPQVSIGTLRLMALRTKEFEGTTEPEWADEEGNWHTCWPKAKGKHPYAARVGVYRKGFRAPVWGVVYFHEVAQTTDVWQSGHKTGEKRFTRFWEDSGIHQVGKCAEADALRKAFEEECGGVYIHEEMLQADTDAPPVTVIPIVDDAEDNEAIRSTAAASAKQNGHKPAPVASPQPDSKPAPKPMNGNVTLGQVRMAVVKAGHKPEEFNLFVSSVVGRVLTAEELNQPDTLKALMAAAERQIAAK